MVNSVRLPGCNRVVRAKGLKTEWNLTGHQKSGNLAYEDNARNRRRALPGSESSCLVDRPEDEGSRERRLASGFDGWREGCEVIRFVPKAGRVFRRSGQADESRIPGADGPRASEQGKKPA